MAEERRNSASNAVSAAKAGKALSKITKGATTGGATGATVAAGSELTKLLIPIFALLMVPIVIVAMLPSIIFGSLFGDGSGSQSGITSDAVLTDNMVRQSTSISQVILRGSRRYWTGSIRTLPPRGVMARKSTIPMARTSATTPTLFCPNTALPWTTQRWTSARQIWLLSSAATWISSIPSPFTMKPMR